MQEAAVKVKEGKGPLYRRIAAVLREEIRTRYSPNDVLPSQRELAARFKASYLTVNNAIKELVEEGLVTRTARAGTFVRDAKTVSRGLVGCLISGKDPWYLSQMFGTVERELREARFRSVVYGGNIDYEQELRAIQEVGRFKEAGLVIYSMFGLQLAREIQELNRNNIPVVSINWPVADCDCARVDQFMIGVLQARYVMEKSCRRVLYVYPGNERFRGLPPYLDGFCATLIEQGFNLDRIHVEHMTPSGVGESAQADLYRQAVQIIRRTFAASDSSVPDAMVVYGDRYLPFIVEELRNAGREPGRDVSLVGADNQNLKGFPYATIDEQLGEIGHHAVRLLLERIDGQYQGPPRIFDIAPRVIVHSEGSD